MEREYIIKHVAQWFRIEPNENGEYDLDDYDWQSGCYHNGKWLSLAEVVECIEQM